MSIAIVVLTHNRVHLLRRCVENVLSRTSEATKEIVIWNNGSTDGTTQYLDSLTDPRLRVVHHGRNIGPSAYDKSFGETSADHLIELDDDVIDAPWHWDSTLLGAFRQLTGVGLLSANLVNNPNDVTARLMYNRDADLYRVEEVNGVRLKVGGPIGGGCAITSRAVYDRVGGFGHNRRLAFWSSDAAYMRKIERLGLRGVYLNDLQVLHAGGAHYATVPDAKHEFWRAMRRRTARRDVVKRGLLVIPFIRGLNERHGWFHPPGST